MATSIRSRTWLFNVVRVCRLNNSFSVSKNCCCGFHLTRESPRLCMLGECGVRWLSFTGERVGRAVGMVGAGSCHSWPWSWWGTCTSAFSAPSPRYTPKSWYTTHARGQPISRQCWSCGKDGTEPFFCGHCGLIQPAVIDQDYFNHFNVFDLSAEYDVDETHLRQLFRNLQRQLHPDKFTNKSEVEQKYSKEQSSLVNKAYQTLQKPLSRSIYLLELHGATLEEQEIQMDPEFLMEIMEINEQLEELKDIDQVRQLGDSNRTELLSLMEEVAVAFKVQDIPRAKLTIARLKYYANIDDKVKERESKYAEEGQL